MLKQYVDMAGQDTLTRQEASEMLGITVRQLDRMIKAGKLVAGKKGGRIVVLRKSDVEALKKQRETVSWD